MTLLPHHRQCGIPCTMLEFFGTLLLDVFHPNGLQNTCTSVLGRVPLLQCMLLSCRLTCSTSRTVHACGRYRLLDDLISGFFCSCLVSRSCTFSSSSLILLGAYQTPTGLNQSSPMESSSLVPFSSIS